MPYEVQVEGHFLTIVPREEWGAAPSKRPLDKMEHPILKCVVTFNTTANKCDRRKECMVAAQDLQKREMDEGADDIKYNFIIGGDGAIYEGRGWFHKSDPSLKFARFRDFRLDIAYMGNYAKGMPDDLRVKFYYLIQYGVGLGYVRYPYETYESTPDWKEFPDFTKPEKSPVREKASMAFAREYMDPEENE